MRTDRNVDFVVSKDGAYCLDFLIKAISLAYDPANTFVDQTLLEQAFNYQAVKHEQTRGKSTIIWICRDKPRAILFQGPRYYLSDIPHVYSAFAIRAHFPIFADNNGRVLRTAHVLTTDACPYKCAFCSEGIGVLGRLNKLSKSPVETQIVRLKQLADFGAEAIFFDDSVMFGGNLTNIRDFSKALISLKDDIQTLGSDSDSFLDITTQRGALNLLNLQWGAQLTGEFFSTLQTPDQAKELLSLMGRSGCTYIYFGIESLAESLIAKIHKHRRQALSGSWHSKIRQSLSLVKSAGIQVGSSVLFGLDGETRETINETILGVANLINDGLLDLASPNIMTYHPGTEITRLHQMENKLDYHSAEHDVRPPYSYFEQAFPGVVSNQLNEDDIWYIHRKATLLWGSKRNSNQTNKYFEVEDEDVRPRHHGVNANK